MAQYRIFQKAFSRIRTVLYATFAVLLLIAAAELARVYLLLHRVTPVLGYLFIVSAAATALVLILTASAKRRNHRILSARGLITDDKSSQKRLARSLEHHIHVCKRIGTQTLLSNDQKKAIRQGAHDLQKALDHHPLRDDLRRGIDTARERIIFPALRELDQINTKVVASKVHAVIEDYYQPYFPALAPWIVVYHQFTLVSEIVDIYLPQPSLGEYTRVLRDTWTTIRRGDLLHHGQRYISSIEAANAPLGDAAGDLIESMSIIWMTHCVATTATLRCTTYHDWDDATGIDMMRKRLDQCMVETRESIARIAMPLLKRRLYRHGIQPGRDVRMFAEETIQSFIKSMDAVALATLQTPRSSTASSASSQHVPVASEPSMQDAVRSNRDTTGDGDSDDGHDHHHRHRRRRSRSSFRRFIDKLTGRDFHF